MAFYPDNATDSTSSVRRQRRLEQDKKRMAYRRAIEDYRDSQILHERLCDFHDLLGSQLRDSSHWR